MASNAFGMLLDELSPPWSQMVFRTVLPIFCLSTLPAFAGKDLE